MDGILETLAAFAQSASVQTRRKLSAALFKLAVSLETPQDTLNRVIYQPQDLAMMQIAADLDLFKLLSENGQPMTVDKIAEATKADPKLLNRVLRHLAAYHNIEETAEQTYAASGTTRVWLKPGFVDAIRFYFNFAFPVIGALPKFLKEHGYKETDRSTETPVQLAYQTDKSVFLLLQDRPTDMENFNRYMSFAHHEGTPSWTTVVPFDKQSSGLSQDRALFVDIAGGIGFQCLEFRKAAPELPGKVVLQDLAGTIAQAPDHQGVEKMVIDIFTEQPVKGAKYYFLRNILHDWSDSECLKILKLTKEAMAEDSILLIDEIVAPNKGAHRYAVGLDIVMLCNLGGKERTEREWRQLLAEAGLRIESITSHSFNIGESVIQAKVA